MSQTFLITLACLFVFTILSAYIKRQAKDRCLNDLDESLVHLERVDGSIITGRLRLEITGMELIYERPIEEAAQVRKSYLLYRPEYAHIQSLIRFHDELTLTDRARRDKGMRSIYRPSSLLRLKRTVLNFFRLVRDSLMDVLNLFVNLAKKRAPGGAILASQDKYVARLKQDVVGSVETAYEPLLEHHIGRRVIFDLLSGESSKAYVGVLKDYTSEFIEVMDVAYRTARDTSERQADLVLLRKVAVVRHLSD